MLCCAVQFTRLCNTLLKRLGRHQVVSKARLLLLIASTTPLFDKSGVGISVSRGAGGGVFEWGRTLNQLARLSPSRLGDHLRR